MRSFVALSFALSRAFVALAAPAGQEVLKPASDELNGVGHFSEWSRATKREFLIDWQEERASEWTMVLGNEGGDLDSVSEGWGGDAKAALQSQKLRAFWPNLVMQNAC